MRASILAVALSTAIGVAHAADSPPQPTTPDKAWCEGIWWRMIDLAEFVDTLTARGCDGTRPTKCMGLYAAAQLELQRLSEVFVRARCPWGPL